VLERGVKYLVSNGATDRLGWILDGLNGSEGWGADVADVLAPEFAAALPPGRFTEIYLRRAAEFAPVFVLGVEVTAAGTAAKARIRVRDGSIYVVECEVEAGPPHRITAAWTTGLVPPGLTPRLPMDFTGSPLPGRAEGAQLIVFSGLPGSGKSTLAEAVGERLGVPVFAIDWLLGALTPFGGYHLESSLEMGSELLTTLALRQLQAARSAILDHPAEEPETRTRWRTLAEQAGSQFKVVMCTCPDAGIHRARLEGRKRGIPGWHDPGNWANVQRRLAEFPPWTGPVLTVDTSQPHADNVAAVLEYLRR
jgi:predicted kinase